MMKPSQISSTAAFIAVKFYGLTRWNKFCSLFDEDVILFYEKLVQSIPSTSHYYHWLLKVKWIRRFFVFWEELLLPGDLMHVLMRKWYLHKMIGKMYQQGYNQLLVIGAGFDHLATIYSQKGLLAVELDAPQMASIKREFAEQEKYQNANLQFCEAFFPRDSIHQILDNKTKLDPSQKTMVVAEGIFDYLEEKEAANLIEEITNFFSNSLVLLTTIFSLQELKPVHSMVYDLSIKLAGEKLKLHLNKEQYCRFIEQQGFTIEQSISYHDMEQDVLKPNNISMQVLPGFYLLKARYQHNE